MKISINKILQYMPKNLTNIEKVRYIYLSIGDLFAYDRDYMYLGREREILAAYSENLTISSIEKRNYSNKIRAICTQIGAIESEAINKMNNVNIKARTVGYDEDLEGHVAVIVNIDGKNYYLDITLDLYKIQKGMKTKGFAKASEALDGTECETISDEALKEIDEKIGYCKNGMYMDDVIEKIRKEMQDERIWDKYIQQYNKSKGEKKEDIICKCKIDFIFKYMKNNTLEKDKMDIIELNKYYQKLFSSLLTAKEKSNMCVGKFDVFFVYDNGEKEDSKLYEIRINNRKFYYLYKDNERGFVETSVNEIISMIENKKIKYCDSNFRPEFNEDESR